MKTAPARVVFALSVAVLASGCSGGEEKAPVETGTPCTSDAQCSAGYWCPPALGRCARAGSAVGPSTTSAAVSPPALPRGGTVSATFRPSAPLRSPPEVWLAAAPRVDLACAANAGGDYGCSAVVPAALADGAYDVLATLAFLDGSVASSQKLGGVTIDSSPPELTGLGSALPHVRQGGTATVEVTFGEIVPAPTVRLAGGGAFSPASALPSASWRFTYVATGLEPQGPASVVVVAEDAAGNEVARTFEAAFVFDFTSPAPDASGVVVETPAVRPGAQARASVTFGERLAGPPVAELVPRAGGTPLAMTFFGQAGETFTYGRNVGPGDLDGEYDVRIRELADLAGNPGATVVQGSLRIDSSAPAMTADPVLSKASGRYRAGEPVAFTFTASEELARAPEATLLTDPAVPFTCTAGAERSWSCTTAALTGAETPAGPATALVELADRAGNTGADALGVVLDFQPPGLVPGTADVALEPAPGSLVSAVSRLGAGGRVRITFTVDEALAAAPELVASPSGALAFTLAGQASTTYAYEAVLPEGPVAQGAYGVEARLTDLAGNSSRPALAFQGAGFAVDTVPPAPPDVGTVDRIVYARVPWGSAATGGRPAFTVVGATGAVEAGATVVAFDGADAAAANELGRTVASGSGAFTLPLGGDAGALHLVAVDGGGTPGDGDAGAPGVQGVKVRDVSWTATLGGKVVGSKGANPHVLEARARFGEDVEGGSAEELILPASTRPTVSLQPAGPTSWTLPAVVVMDPVRGVHVGFEGSTVMEFDGAEWRAFTNDYGPGSVQSAAFHPRLREILVYAGSCRGGAVLWSWNGRRWKVRGEGISYPAQLEASSRTVPGPHPNSNLVFHEARGELVLTGGVMGSPYQCGDVAGRPDLRTWTWTEAGWSLREDVPTTGPTAYDPASRSLVTVTAGGFSSWDGTAVVEAAVSDPEQDGNPTFHSLYWLPPFAIDPATGTRILLDGQTWWSDGHSWVRGATSAAGLLVADEPGRRLLLADADGLAAWRSGGWEKVVAPTEPSPAPTPIAMIWNAGANRLELFSSDGQVLGWDGVRWAAIAPGDPEGDGNPSGLSAAAADPMGGGVLATSTDLWRWTGSSWAMLMAGTSLGDLLTWPGAGVYRRQNNDWYRWTGFAWDPVPGTTQFPHSLGGLRFAGYSPSLGGFVASYTANLVGDSRVSTWNPTTGWATGFTEIGFGRLQALPADGFGRNFALHDATRLYLLGGAPFVAAAAVENPLEVAFPAGYSASAWNPSEGAVFLWDGGTWRLDTEPTSQLGHLLRIAYAASGGPALEACLDPAVCAVRSIHLEWTGRASTEQGVAPNRVRLLAWGGVRWLEVASAEGNAGADLHASATVIDPGLIGRMVAGPDAELDFAIRTSGPHTRDALLRTDDVSVTVRYRLR